MADELLGILLSKEAKQQLKKEGALKGLKVSQHARMILLEHLQASSKEKPSGKKGKAK